MKKNNKKIQPSSDEIRQLQSKVVELEHILNSIQSGGVDALIIKNKMGQPAVFTLEGADQPYRLLLESLSEGALSLSEKGIIMHCNKQFSDMVKVSTENLVNSSFFDYIPEYEHKLLTHLLNQSKLESCRGEFTLLAIDNTKKFILLSCHSLSFGSIEGISIVATDITEIKMMQKAINTAKDHYQALMDNASCGFFVSDQQGNIIEANKQTEKIFGASRNDIVGYNLKKYVPTDEHEYVDIQLEKMRIEKKIGLNEGHIQQPNGDIISVEFSAVSIDLENETLCLSIVNDVTERNRLRSQMLLNDKLTMVGTMAASIIHEINNPTTWVLSNLSFLKNKINELKLVDDPHQAALLSQFNETIQDSLLGTEKIKDIVKELKEFARADDPQVKTLTDIHEALNSAINMASPHLKNVAIVEKIYAKNIPKLLLSKTKLQQVFLNLVVNAVQSFDNNISENIIQIETKKLNNTIQIEVRDTGKGMPPEVCASIFEPFYTTKPPGIGTGLGLSICYDIIHRNGGEISVESTPKKGTKFTINLPLTKQKKSSALNMNGHSKRILVISDNREILQQTKHILGNNCEITAILGGRNALTSLKEKTFPFDILICDLIMPDVSGSDLYRYIAKNYPENEKRIIFIIDNTCSKITDTFLTSISNVCIKKPMTRTKLLKCINKISLRVSI